MAPIKSPCGFRFLPTDGPFSGGVAAEPGFSIVRVHLPAHTELGKGFQLVEKSLSAAGRPMAALCAMELRIPKPLTRDGFDEFNRGYVNQHERWGLSVGGRMPAARTNVAPEIDPPEVACLHAFCYTIVGEEPRTNFIISGVPEPPGTQGGLPSYWTEIVGILEERMGSLGVAWNDATETQFYGTRADHQLFAATQLARFKELARPGLKWFFSRPPIDDLHLEIDVRGLAADAWT